MTVLKLSYIPIEFSEHVYLDGVEIQRDQFTVDYDLGKITTLAGADTRSGDRLECRYAHYGDDVPQVTGVYVTRNYGGTFTGSTAYLATYAHTAGNLLIGMFGANFGDITPTPGDGWIFLASANNGYGHVVRWWYKVGNGSTSAVTPALSGLTWYCWTMFEFGDGLTSVADIAMVAASGVSQTVPAIGSGGRMLHSFAIAPGNSGYSISPWPRSGDTNITSTSWGNSNDFWHSTGIDTNGASSHTASTSIEGIGSTLALA